MKGNKIFRVFITAVGLLAVFSLRLDISATPGRNSEFYPYFRLQTEKGRKKSQCFRVGVSAYGGVMSTLCGHANRVRVVMSRGGAIRLHNAPLFKVISALLGCRLLVSHQATGPNLVRDLLGASIRPLAIALGHIRASSFFTFPLLPVAADPVYKPQFMVARKNTWAVLSRFLLIYGKLLLRRQTDNFRDGKGIGDVLVKSESMNELLAACGAAEIPIYGKDFLCRVLAILHCYGGGPGSEYFRAGAAYAAAMKAGDMLEDAVMQKNWDTVKKFRAYVRELQADNAPWLKRTLDKLNIPAKEIKFQECVQPKSPRGT